MRGSAPWRTSHLCRAPPPRPHPPCCLRHLQDAKEVHLDDNLRRANLSAPLMVTPASQRQLELALWADTTFLSGLAIMDYSLLVRAARAA